MTTFLQQLSEKHFVVEWLSWLPNESGFINYNISETSKDRPNTSPSMKLLEQRFHELVGGGGGDPLNLSLDNVVRSTRLRSGRVKTASLLV